MVVKAKNGLFQNLTVTEEYRSVIKSEIVIPRLFLRPKIILTAKSINLNVPLIKAGLLNGVA